MKTKIIIEAEMTDEQYDVLISEIERTCEIIGIKLETTVIELGEVAKPEAK